MSFWASAFIFDGIPSERFGLMLYNLAGHEQSDGTMGGKVKIIENRISRCHTSLHCGVIRNEPMEFKLIFGVADDKRRLDRFDLEAISKWLVGHQQYKWLHICQPDMEHIRYRCMVTQLVPITISALHIAFEATVICDGPYAYHVPVTNVIDCNNSTRFLLRNPCNVPDYFCWPNLFIESKPTSNTLKIINLTTGDEPFTVSGLEKFIPIKIEIDGRIKTIQTSCTVPIYEMSNLKFIRLISGDNLLKIDGDAIITIVNEAPINIGS